MKPEPNERPGDSHSEGKRCEELLESVQRLTGTGIWSYDSATDRTWWSEQAQRVLGIEPGRRPAFAEVVDHFVDEDRSRAMDRFSTALEAGDPFEIEVSLAVEGTAERFLRLCAEPRQRAGAPVALHGTVRDVTGAKRQEQRIEVLRRTSQQLREANSQQAVAAIMADASKNILGLDNTTIRLLDESEGVLRTVVATDECTTKAGERPDYPVDEATPAARTYRSGEPELHTDHSTTEDDHNRGELRSGLYVPIGDHGVLSAGNVVVNAFDEQDIDAASLLGQLGAKAITRIGWTTRSRAI